MIGATVMSHAQTEISESKFYIKVYGGYGLITPGSYKLVSSSNAGGASGNTSLSKQGLGAGIRAGGGIGVIISDFLNIGADVEYLSGSSLKSSTSYLPPTGYSFISRTEITYTSLSITPHVVFKALSKPDYLIYNRFGILLNMPMNIKKTEFDSSFTVGYNYSANKTGTYKIGLTAGLSVALGVQMRLTDKLRGFAELFGNYLVLSPSNYDENRTEVANGKTVNSDNHTIFIKDGQISNSTNGNTTTSTISVYGNTFNMNSVGINIGITYRF
jgi:hypothetical protein